jgi:hypothetical protein
MRKSTGNAFAVVLVVAASGVVLGGCTGGGVADCEQLLEGTALSVEGVDSADFTCRRDFGDSGQRGAITLAVDTQREATPVIEDVYRAFASEPDIGSAWTVYITFTAVAGGSEFNDEALDFNGDPTMRDIRERYDIHPAGAD